MATLPKLRPSDAVNLAGQETGREHLSHSQLATQLNCLRKYELHYIDRLELISRPKPLSLGSAFQLAVEHGDPAAGAKAFREEAVILSQEDEDRVRVEETIVKSAAALYLARWGASDGRREFEYRVRLRSPWTGAYSNTFDLLGYADELAEDDDGLVLVENKLVGQITPVSVRRLPLDRQVALSSYGIWRATGQRVVKVRYRFVRKPSIKQRQNETLNLFLARLAADYRDRPDFYSVEESPMRLTDDLIRIEAELWEWADQLRRARRSRVYPRNTSVCHEYGGCAFLPICCGDPDAMGLYRVRERAARVSKSTTSQPLREAA